MTLISRYINENLNDSEHIYVILICNTRKYRYDKSNLNNAMLTETKKTLNSV